MATTPSLMFALRHRFPAPAWAFLEQVRSCTGYVRATRYADALAMSLWPSRGLELHGVEVKISRSDWLRELKKPEKADAIQPYCDRWWIAVPGGDVVVHVEELPPTWGLLVQHGKKMVAQREAPKLDAQPLDRALLAAILRNVNVNCVPTSRVQELAEERAEALRESYEGRLAASERCANNELTALKDSLRAFEEASGIAVGRWEGRNIGAAVKAALCEKALAGRLQHAQRTLRECAKLVDEALGRVSES